MKLLMIYPEYPDTFWSFKHILKFISKKAAFPPLGLLTIAAMLPKEWDLMLVDMNVSKLTDEKILWADYVFISAMIVQKESAIKVIKICKSLGKKIVAGGPLFSTAHENFPDVDHFVLNEAEVTLPIFIDDLKKNNLKNIYSSTQKPDVTKIPVPKWSLINFEDYSTMVVQYSRGCPFNCEFCDIIVMNGRIPRAKSNEQFIEEIQTLYNHGWRGSIFIVDDNFIGNKLTVKKMLYELIKWQKNNKYPFKFFTEASINLADDKELMQMMSDANFYKVFLGIESPNVDSLRECNKHQNVNRNLIDAIKTIQTYGMQVMGGFIVGFDNDEESIFDNQIHFIQNAGVVIAMVGVLTALPKTQLWHRLKSEGRLLSETTGGNTDGRLNFTPKLARETLMKGYKRLFSIIYSPNNYYKRINILLKNYKPTVRSKVKTADLKAFVKSAWQIGIKSKSRRYFWPLVIKTAIIKRKSLSTAVELAIVGLHFERISKNMT